MMKTTKRLTICIMILALLLLLVFVGSLIRNKGVSLPSGEIIIDLEEIPPWEGNPYTEINGNIPLFKEEALIPISFEKYEELDTLGRCTYTYACIGKDLMPTSERESIGMIKPSGWPKKTIKYDFIDDKYLYNRCHLIGYQLTGENANINNLITGTRYLNIEGMLPFENKVANYVRRTKNHVLYRVIPDFRSDELIARGVFIEAYSIEDRGRGICFYVYCYNEQPNLEIDRYTGEAKLIEE